MRGRTQSLGDQARKVQGGRSVQSLGHLRGSGDLCLTSLGLGWGQVCLHHNLGGGTETGCGDVFLEKSEGNREFGVGFYAKRGQWGWETVG